jgi:hypothetical protein
MKRKRSSRQSSARSPLDQDYSQLLTELQRSILSGWTGATSPGDSASLEHLSRFAGNIGDIITVLQQVHSQQTERIETLEVLLYDLEGRQKKIEESIGEEEGAGRSKFLTSLNRWIADIDSEIARGL